VDKETLNPHQAQTERIHFVEKAVGEGVLGKISVSERDQNIALVSILNDERTGKDIGETFPQNSGKALSRERVRQMRVDFLKKSHKYVSPELQALHALEEFLIKKPAQLGEKNQNVKKLIGVGINPADMREISSSELTTARKILGRRGIEVPQRQKTYRYFREMIMEENDDTKLQNILEQHASRIFEFNFRSQTSPHPNPLSFLLSPSKITSC
jgi:hypothetical protein